MSDFTSILPMLWRVENKNLAGPADFVPVGCKTLCCHATDATALNKPSSAWTWAVIRP